MANWWREWWRRSEEFRWYAMMVGIALGGVAVLVISCTHADKRDAGRAAFILSCQERLPYKECVSRWENGDTELPKE